MTSGQRILIAIALILGLGSAFSSASAQDYVPTPVTISGDRVKIEGKIYYAHVVLEKQTLFSIAKAYGVSVEDIYSANGGLKEDGLRTGSVIYIPYNENLPQAGEEVKAEEEEVIYHTVKWNDTLWSISQQYGVSVDDIIKANNLADTKIRKKQRLIIPQGQQPVMTNTIVQPVPPSETGTVVEADDTAEIVTPEEETVSGNEYDNTEGWVYNLHSKKEVSAALLIPFTSGGKKERGNIDFYCGVLLALGDLKDKGITTDLDVYDVSGNTAVSADKLKGKDIVIGPISPEAVKKEIGKCEEGTYLVSPLNQKVLPLANSFSNLIQAPVPLTDQYEDIARWIAEDYSKGDKVLLISDNNSSDKEFPATIRRALSDNGIGYDSFGYTITQGRTISGSIANHLKKEGVNRVIVLSTAEAFLGDAIRNLNVLTRKGYDIVLYSPSKVRDYDNTIESEYLHNLNLHMTASYSIDYNDRRVMDFILRYRALYNTEPSKMAFQGYDTAYYFISMLSTYGVFFRPFMTTERFDLLQASFLFKKTDSGSMVNHAVRRVIYGEDYTVRPVKL